MAIVIFYCGYILKYFMCLEFLRQLLCFVLLVFFFFTYNQNEIRDLLHKMRLEIFRALFI